MNRVLQNIIILFLVLPFAPKAQMQLKSVGSTKPFYLELGYQDRKGGYVWYKGQQQPMALKFKSLDIDSSERASGQPDFYHYKFLEIYQGKVTGEYGFTEWPRNLDDIYYLRYKDSKRFKLSLIEDNVYTGKSMVLANDVQFHYYITYKDSLTIRHKDGTSHDYLLSALDEENDRVRYVSIADYNFDGIADVSFSVTDGQGANTVYDVFIYDSRTKKFNQLQLPKGANDCGYFINLKRDLTRKQLSTTCKSNGSWKGYAYKFNHLGKLVLLNKKCSNC